MEHKIQDDKWIPSTCSGCYANCPIRVHRVNGVAVKIQGEPNSPSTEGAICGKGVAGLQVLYDPNRLNYPVMRTNPEKGIGVDPKWKRISWDEALDIIAEKLKEIYHTNPKQLLSQTTPTTGGVGSFVGFFGAAFGADANTGGGGLFCGNATHLFGGMVHGAWSYTCDFERCSYVLYFGTSKGHGAGHSAGAMMKLAANGRSRGMKMVAFDPVSNFAGGKATEWVPIIPGTDAAVALAMVNILLNDLGIYDVEHIKTRTNGPFLIGPDRHYLRDKESGKPLVWDAGEGKAKVFDDPGVKEYALEGKYTVNGIKCEPAFQLLKEGVKKYTPEMASEISTVPAATIRRIAAEFGQAAGIGSTINIQGKTLPLRPAAALLFRGINGHRNAFNTVGAINLLNEIVGANDVPGGAIGWPTRFLGFPETGHHQLTPSADPEGFLISGWWMPRLHKMWPLKDPKLPNTAPTMKDLFPWVVTSPFVAADDRKEWQEKTGMTSKLKAILNWGANTPMSHPNKNEVAASLKEVPFIFSFRLFLDEYSDFCDIVLPDACYLEALFPADNLAVGFSGPTGMTDWYFQIKQPVVEPQFERRMAIEVLLDLARRIDPKLVVATYEMINIALVLREPYKLESDPSKVYSWEDICDRALKSYFGEERGLEWFKENGGIKWSKKVEEGFFRPFVKNLRSPIYYEWVVGWEEKVRKVAEPAGIQLDWRHYTPVPEYFPNPPSEVTDPSYDIYGITYRDIIHTGSSTMQNPWIDEASQMNPYTYNVHISEEMGKKKGLKDGDAIWLEADNGRRVGGVVKLMQGIHPQVLGVTACAGHWSPNLPIAKGKGTHFDDLLVIDKEHLDPVCLSMETTAKLKIYKADRR